MRVARILLPLLVALAAAGCLRAPAARPITWSIRQTGQPVPVVQQQLAISTQPHTRSSRLRSRLAAARAAAARCTLAAGGAAGIRASLRSRPMRSRKTAASRAGTRPVQRARADAQPAICAASAAAILCACNISRGRQQPMRAISAAAARMRRRLTALCLCARLAPIRQPTRSIPATSCASWCSARKASPAPTWSMPAATSACR